MTPQRPEPASEAAFLWEQLKFPFTFTVIMLLPQLAFRYAGALLRSFPVRAAIVTCAMLVFWPLFQSMYRPPRTFAFHARHSVATGFVFAALQEGSSNGFNFGPILAIVFALLLEFVPLRPIVRRSA